MGALIDIANKVSSNLLKNPNKNTNDKLVTLLKQKIEDFINDDKEIVVNVSTPLVGCRNSILVEDYEIDEEYLYLNNGKFELHINLYEVEIRHNNIFDESFTFLYNDTTINIYFLE